MVREVFDDICVHFLTIQTQPGNTGDAKIAISAENPHLLLFKKALFFDISNVNRITAGLLFN